MQAKILLKKDFPAVPCKPIYNLHLVAGGSPPSGFSASNFQTASCAAREACNSREEIGIPYYKCGFKKAYHEQSREIEITIFQ